MCENVLRTCTPSEDSDQTAHICAVCSEYSLGAFWIVKDAKVLPADNEDCVNAKVDMNLRWANMSDVMLTFLLE